MKSGKAKKKKSPKPPKVSEACNLLAPCPPQKCLSTITVTRKVPPQLQPSVDVEESDSSQAQAEQAEVARSTEAVGLAEDTAISPWPFTNGFFHCASAVTDRGKSTKYTYRCLQCSANIRCDGTTSSNLKRHYKRKHSELSHALLSAVPPSQRRRLAAEEPLPSTPPPLASTSGVATTLNHWWRSRSVSQEVLNNQLAKLIVDSMLPFSFVDSPQWKFFANVCLPDKTTIGRTKLMTIIGSQYRSQTQALKDVMGTIKCVATTGDCWTGAHR